LINTLKLNVFSLLFLAILLPGCNNEIELKDGDQLITEEMDEVISNYIVQKYASSYGSTDTQFDVHKVYGTSESDGVLSVYMWSYYGGFNKTTGIENQAGHSLPAVIRLKKEANGYSVSEYKEPQDGNLFQSSLKKMFPEKYVEMAQQDIGNIKDLQKEMDKKVKRWLEE
jgi:hypothetical protein